MLVKGNNDDSAELPTETPGYSVVYSIGLQNENEIALVSTAVDEASRKISLEYTEQLISGTMVDADTVRLYKVNGKQPVEVSTARVNGKTVEIFYNEDLENGCEYAVELPKDIAGEEMYKTYATGNAGMLIAAGDIPRKLTKYGMKPEQVGIMALPAGPKRHVTLLGGSIAVIAPNATESRIDAGIRWIEGSANFKVTDEVKINLENRYQTNLADG